GQWQQALSFLTGLRRSQLTASSVTYSAVISACGQAALWELAIHLLEEQIRAGAGGSRSEAKTDPFAVNGPEGLKMETTTNKQLFTKVVSILINLGKQTKQA
ncbi:unnamed protein product, partial [Polarella glacialis]